MPVALVLTAGLGTRLRPLTRIRAKPAIPVAGDALARRIIRRLAAHDVREIVLNLHHLPPTITAVVGDGSDLGARVRYSWEFPAVLGSAGGPRHALDILGAPTFFIINGDTLTDVDPAAVMQRHRDSGARVTLALVPNTAPHHYGGVLVDDAGRVSGFVGAGPGAVGSYHFIGVQVANRDVFAGLPDNTPLNSIGGVYDELLRDRPGSIAAHVSNASFWDIGTPLDYLNTSLAFAAAEMAAPPLAGARTRIDASARVRDSVLWDDVEVGAGCRVSRCVVATGVRLEPGAAYEDAVLTKSDGGVEATPLT